MEMMLTQRILGLTFERFDAIKKSEKGKELSDVEENLINLSFYEYFCYIFNFLGIIMGPYITYSTYYDHFNLPFNPTFSQSFMKMKESVKTIIITFSIYSITSLIWPIEYAMSNEFYEDRLWIYRVFYMIPLFLIFRMRIYAGAKFSELIMLNAGMGAYPRISKSKCGKGPTEKITKEMIENYQNIDDYDFETINMFNISKFESCLYFRESIRDHWNCLVQFWLYNIVYKRIPFKGLKVIVTQIFSGLWHGFELGYLFCLILPVLYLPVENIYREIFKEKQSKNLQLIINLTFWTMKSFFLAYMNVAFCFKDFNKFWKYYKSIYYVMYVIPLILYFVGLIIIKFKLKLK